MTKENFGGETESKKVEERKEYHKSIDRTFSLAPSGFFFGDWHENKEDFNWNEDRRSPSNIEVVLEELEAIVKKSREEQWPFEKTIEEMNKKKLVYEKRSDKDKFGDNFLEEDGQFSISIGDASSSSQQTKEYFRAAVERWLNPSWQG